MANNSTLSKNQEQTLIGKTSVLYQEGLSSEEIANKLGQPNRRVLKWMQMCDKAKANK